MMATVRRAAARLRRLGGRLLARWVRFTGMSLRPLQLVITRGGRRQIVSLEAFDEVAFESGDELSLTPAYAAATLPTGPDGTRQVVTRTGKSIRVPSRMHLFEYKGFRI